MALYFVYITTSNYEEAHTIGKFLVKEHLAACVNIIKGMNSIYWWEGQIQEDSEIVLIAKTTEEKMEALTNRVKEMHSYSCPCIIAVPIVDGNEEYLSWIRKETRTS